MFARWGELVHRLRYTVLGLTVAALLALGGYGIGVEDHLSSSGLFDPTAESSRAAEIADRAFGRNHDGDVLLIVTAPPGKTVDDPDLTARVVEHLNRLPREHPNEIAAVNASYWPGAGALTGTQAATEDRTTAFAALALLGDNDTDVLANYRKVKDEFTIPGVDVRVAGLQAVAGTINDTMADDITRMEKLAFPAVAVLLFFIFGGLIAAALPLLVGALTVAGANGIVMALTHLTQVNSFVSGVISMVGLGLAIDYGLFIVSRFREELAEGHDTPAAVRRTVTTAGRTVVYSATMVIASLAGLLIFPQGFLKSIAYGAIATVALAALTAITVLPATLALLGPRVDKFGLQRFRRTRTAEQVENSFWGRTARWVMRRPLRVAIPLSIGLFLLIIPMKNLVFGGLSEKYLPADNPVRIAQHDFDEQFKLRKADPLMLIVLSDNTADVGRVRTLANEAPGLAEEFEVPKPARGQPGVYRMQTPLIDSAQGGKTIEYLRAMDIPEGTTLLVGGKPALEKDSIDALLYRIPFMILLVVVLTGTLMFLTFGSIVLPIKAILMSALGLGSTLGILTWIFVDGHGANLLHFTPQPIMAPVLVLIIAIIYGLSTDYEVFLLSRMVEARARGASTVAAIGSGTAHTGRIITAAALILLVVTGAFAFSDLVMMQYIAYGMIAALVIDATLLRMLLVPAVMRLLGDDCWWAPAPLRRLQERIGMREPDLGAEQPVEAAPVQVSPNGFTRRRE
ncbi:MMPL family transporter [Nocardia panacis]|uniref:MMPL family transporter n=1 Tax=Nocardia panacis TaxID=2340916 RepID=A0A3A4KU69_9NOCA|nr:MMPL family transporter [Nocardia panacis]RJO73414.1 MMPL family transporter [Nocardia panacis]